LDLTPEERRHIYEEEKARLEAEANAGRGDSGTTGLPPGLAGLLCYLGMWVTGIIFLVLEQHNRQIRFHAAQSIVTFGALTLLSIVLRFIPFVGGLLATVVGITVFILWLVLMVKAYRGEFYRLPLASDLADALLNAVSGVVNKSKTAEVVVPVTAPPEPPPTPRSRTGNILESVFAIIFSLVMLVIINVYYDYIAYYWQQDGVWVRQSLVTGEWHTWLPVVNTAIILSVIAHVVLIIDGRRLVRESGRIIIDVLTIIVMGSLLSVFPFDFHPLPIPEALAVFMMRMGLGISMIVLIVVAVVRLVRLIIAVLRT